MTIIQFDTEQEAIQLYNFIKNKAKHDAQSKECFISRHECHHDNNINIPCVEIEKTTYT